jgi:transcription-repair coupling factor (superfamily II helicase)
MPSRLRPPGAVRVGPPYVRAAMSSATTVDDVIDPGLAVGPLAAALRPGRAAWDVELLDPDLVAPPVLRPYVLSLLAERSAPLLVLVPRTSDAEGLADDLGAFLGAGRVAVFPAWETLPHERLSPQPRTVGRRLHVLDRLLHPGEHEEPLLAVVAPVRAALQPMDPSLGRRRPVALDRRWEGFDALVDDLAGLGYSRTPQVETRGEFAVRGGIVDVFPTAGDHAVRIEFFGDDVESIRSFAVADQRSTDHLDELVIDPARELVLDEQVRARATAALDRWPSLRGELEQLVEGQAFEGAEALVTLLTPRPALLPEFLPDGAGVALVDPLLLAERATKLGDEAEVLATTAWAGEEVGDHGGFVTPEELLERSPDRVWRLQPFGAQSAPAWRPAPGNRSAATSSPSPSAWSRCSATSDGWCSAATARGRCGDWRTCWPSRPSPDAPRSISTPRARPAASRSCRRPCGTASPRTSSGWRCSAPGTSSGPADVGPVGAWGAGRAPATPSCSSTRATRSSTEPTGSASTAG